MVPSGMNYFNKCYPVFKIFKIQSAVCQPVDQDLRAAENRRHQVLTLHQYELQTTENKEEAIKGMLTYGSRLESDQKQI